MLLQLSFKLILSYNNRHVLVGYVGEKCHLASSLDSYGELSLVESAGAGNTSGKDLSSLGNELSELSYVLVINSVNLILTEDANLLSSVVRTEGTRRIIHFLIQFLSNSRFLYFARYSESHIGRTGAYQKGRSASFVISSNPPASALV